MSIVEIIIVSLGVLLFIVVGLAIFYYHKIARLLRGGEGWALYRFGASAYLLAFLFATVESITKNVTYIYLSNSSLIIGSVIFAYAFFRIRLAVKEVTK